MIAKEDFNLKITGSIRQETLILYFNGELDHHSADSTREAIDNMIQRYRFNRVIFNLSELSFIDSSGIGVFYGRRKIIKMDGGRCAIVGITKKTERFIHVSGLDKMFEIYSDEDEALAVWNESID